MAQSRNGDHLKLKVDRLEIARQIISFLKKHLSNTSLFQNNLFRYEFPLLSFPFLHFNIIYIKTLHTATYCFFTSIAFG